MRLSFVLFYVGFSFVCYLSNWLQKFRLMKLVGVVLLLKYVSLEIFCLGVSVLRLLLLSGFVSAAYYQRGRVGAL